MTDFGAVVAELRLFHHNAAADAVEALVAENAEQRSRIGALEAAISGALELADAHDWAEEDWLQIGRIRTVLSLAPSVVLDGMIREAKAEALLEVVDEWSGKTWLSVLSGELTKRALAYRNGGA